MYIFDAHTHLNHEELFVHWQQHLEDFRHIGGRAIINVGANEHYNARGILIAQQGQQFFPDLRCKATVGIHPCDISNQHLPIQDTIEQLEKLITSYPKEIVAVGECGIDLYYPDAYNMLTVQHDFFYAQCKLARKFQLPIIIHSRSAFDETLAILKDFQDLKIYFHCWSYTSREIQILLNHLPQVWIGFTGLLTYPKAPEIRASLLSTPKDRILIETDAPYLAPQGFRGQINTPQRVKEIGMLAAELLQLSETQLRSLIEKNFTTLYSAPAEHPAFSS